MKRILIASHWMEIGGAERSLLGLLDSIDYKKYQIDLFLCSHRGEFMKLINKNVNLLPEDKKATDIAVPITNVIKHGNIDIVIGRVIASILSKIYLTRNKIEKPSIVPIENSHKFTYKFINRINEDITYDLAISFLEPHYIVTNKVNAKKKIAWIHTDYMSIDSDIKEGYKVWDSYDNIIAISEDCRNNFLKKFPNLKNKIVLVENIISKDFLLEQSKLMDISSEINNNDRESIKLLSIGRFSEAKNFDNIPEICKFILEKGINIKWYIMGYGGDENLIKHNIEKYKLQENVILLGKKENPYPYIKACDIYVQPSRYEGKAVAVREAQILNKPVVITDFPTSKSQLKDGFDGVIVPIDNQGCAEGICNLIKDKELQQRLIENTKITDYTNKQELEKIYALLEG